MMGYDSAGSIATAVAVAVFALAVGLLLVAQVSR